MNVEKDIYFVDLENAFNEPTKSFSKKIKTFSNGGGYQPKPLYKIMSSKIYNETYDGLIL
jgi:erythromycin esterase